ncbi:hypothetical protein E4T56_gene13551 [Termitomyces sp. T112]|nr:hypothetical protein E4T56_gene13551 [Termitomyces sp. T112]
MRRLIIEGGGAESVNVDVEERAVFGEETGGEERMGWQEVKEEARPACSAAIWVAFALNNHLGKIESTITKKFKKPSGMNPRKTIAVIVKRGAAENLGISGLSQTPWNFSPAVRIAITEAHKDASQDTHPELPLSHLLSAVYSSASLNPKLIEDISVGKVHPASGWRGADAARTAAYREPDRRRRDQYWHWCMTMGFGPSSMPSSFSPKVLTDPLAEKGGAQSITDNSAKLKLVFTKNEAMHAGNASQVSEGAVVVFLARRDAAERLGLPVRDLLATVGVPLKIMGVGSAYAIPKILSVFDLLFG